MKRFVEGVDRGQSTLFPQEQHPEFRDSITRGKIDADAKVAQRMYKRALGYSHPAVKIFMPQGAKEPVYAPYTEPYPPDTQAASLWLRNRQPARWRDRQDLTHDVGGTLGEMIEQVIALRA